MAVGMIVASSPAAKAQAPTTLYSFCAQSGCTDGGSPRAGLVQGSDGNFYGTTPSGGPGKYGTVFKITPSGALTTLYSFCTIGCVDGKSPYAGLVQGSDGNFYGTTEEGGVGEFGQAGMGTVFKITPSGAHTTLYNFCCGTDGEFPLGGLVQGSDGNFYGTTEQGGVGSGMGGTIFKITPSGTLTTLYSFCTQSACSDGTYIPAGLVEGSDGNFYGTTEEGGLETYGGGTIFKITPSGALTTLYRFCSQSSCSDGEFPYAGLVQGSDGNFYGTTPEGGLFGKGTIFKITPSGALTTLYSFCFLIGCPDGFDPLEGLVQGRDGNFYGTTEEGGANGKGTIFKITPSGSLTTLYSFCAQSGCTDGSSPFGWLVQGRDGNFYGTTSEGGGGAYGSGGIVFKLRIRGAPGDYDGDGKSDISVWRPSSGQWFIIPSSNPGTPIIQPMGHER